jgi:hypothetical protein
MIREMLEHDIKAEELDPSDHLRDHVVSQSGQSSSLPKPQS